VGDPGGNAANFGTLPTVDVAVATLKGEGQVLKDVVGPWFGTFFWYVIVQVGDLF
jgi:hypothetical protein